MEAAKDGDVTTLQHLIQDNKMDIDTRGGLAWVSR